MGGLNRLHLGHNFLLRHLQARMSILSLNCDITINRRFTMRTPKCEDSALNKPMILFSLPFSPSPFISLRVFSRSGTAISSMALQSFSCSFRVSVGRRKREGKMLAKMNATAVATPGFTWPIASKTSATADGLLSSEPKS